MFEILERYFLLRFFSKIYKTLSLLAFLLAWPLVESSQISIVNKALLSLTIIPYTAYLVLPLALALAWLITRNDFANSGEWLGLIINGWQIYKSAVTISVLGGGLMLLLAIVSQAPALQEVQANIVNKNQVVLQDQQLLLNLPNSKMIFVASKDAITISKTDSKNALSQSLYQKNMSVPKYNFHIKNANLPKIKPRLHLVYYDKVAMLFLLIIMLLWAVLNPLQNTSWPLFYGVASSLLVYVSNIQLIHWLSKIHLPEYLPPLLCACIFGLYYYLRSPRVY